MRPNDAVTQASGIRTMRIIKSDDGTGGRRKVKEKA
jgi:hypothetical protein